MAGGEPGRGEPTNRSQRASDRRAELLALVRQAGFYGAGELSQRLGVSEMTVRRDIHRLDQEGLVRAVYGGVTKILPEELPLATDFSSRSEQHSAEKEAIAERARALIEPDSSIAIDAGTTTLALARLVPADQRISVVTHSLPAMALLATRSGVEVIGVGGVLHPETQAFAGPVTSAQLDSVRVKTLFLGISGIRGNELYCGNQWDAVTKRALIDIADEVVVLADSSKFRRPAKAFTAAADVADTLIVDDRVRAEDVAPIEAAGVQVVVAPVRERQALDGREAGVRP